MDFIECIIITLVFLALIKSVKSNVYYLITKCRFLMLKIKITLVPWFPFGFDSYRKSQTKQIINLFGFRFLKFVDR